MAVSLDDELAKDALELNRLDRMVVKAIVDLDREQLPRLLIEYSDLKNEIKKKLLDYPVSKIHDHKAKEILRRISVDEALQTDRILQAINSQADEPVSLGELENEEINELGSSIFYSWFSHYEYIEALFDIGSLIVGISVPPLLVSYVTEARQCYAFQQYNAVYALCRTILETAIRDIGERRGLVDSSRDKLAGLDSYRPKELIRRVSKGPLREKIQELYDNTSLLVHGRKEVNSAEARKTFKEMLRVVHALYQ